MIFKALSVKQKIKVHKFDLSFITITLPSFANNVLEKYVRKIEPGMYKVKSNYLQVFAYKTGLEKMK